MTYFELFFDHLSYLSILAPFYNRYHTFGPLKSLKGPKNGPKPDQKRTGPDQKRTGPDRTTEKMANGPDRTEQKRSGAHPWVRLHFLSGIFGGRV